jgi:hypothetical protein
MRKVLQEARVSKTPLRSPAGRWLPWVFSAVLALILWITAIQDRSFTVSMTLPVTPPALPGELMLMGDLSADSVRVDFRGIGALVMIDQVFRRPSVISLGEFDPGTGGDFPRTISYQLTGSNVSFNGPRSLALAAEVFTPVTVSLLVDRKMRRSIPLNVPSEGEIPGRFMWPVFSTRSVDINGAATVIIAMDSIQTDPIRPGEDPVRVALVPPQGVSGISPRTISASYITPVPVVFDTSD